GRAVGAWGVRAQNGRKRRMVEVAIPGFLKNAVAGQKAEYSIKRGLVRFAGAGEMFDWLRLAGLNEIGNAELGDGADGAAERGADHKTTEMFGFLLSHEVACESCGTLSHRKTQSQELNFRVADRPSSAIRRGFADWHTSL